MASKNAKQLVYRDNGVEASEEVEVDRDGAIAVPAHGDTWKELMQRSHVMSECSTTDPEWMQQFAEQAVRLGKKAA